MTLFGLYKLKKTTQKIFCSAKMITKTNDAARGQNLLSNMALEEKSKKSGHPGLFLNNFINKRVKL